MALITASIPVVASASSSRASGSPFTGGGRTAGLLLGVASALAFSSSGPFVKPLLEAGWSLGAALLVRLSVSALLLSPWLVRALLRDRRLIPRHWKLILGLGLTGMAGCQLFYFAALQRMPVAIALLVQYIAPVLLVLYAWVRTKHAPSRVVVWGSLAAIVGLVMVVDISGARFDLLGTCYALIAAVCVAFYFQLLGNTTDDLPPLALASAGLWVGASAIGILAAFGVLPVIAPAVDVVLAGVTVPWWVAMGWIACVATTLGYAFGVLAVPRLGAKLAAFVGLSEVLFAMLFAWLLLSEQPTLIQGLGSILIVSGVILVRADRSGAPRGEAARIPAVPAP